MTDQQIAVELVQEVIRRRRPGRPGFDLELKDRIHLRRGRERLAIDWDNLFEFIIRLLELLGAFNAKANISEDQYQVAKELLDSIDTELEM